MLAAHLLVGFVKAERKSAGAASANAAQSKPTADDNRSDIVNDESYQRIERDALWIVCTLCEVSCEWFSLVFAGVPDT